MSTTRIYDVLQQSRSLLERSCREKILQAGLDMSYLDYLYAIRDGVLRPDVDILDACADVCPHTTIELAGKHLSPETLDYCVQRSPYSAVEFVAGLLSPEQLDYCVIACPWLSMEYAEDVLTEKQKRRCRSAIKKRQERTIVFPAVTATNN